jgi:hypothetical protein
MGPGDAKRRIAALLSGIVGVEKGQASLVEIVSAECASIRALGGQQQFQGLYRNDNRLCMIQCESLHLTFILLLSGF